MNMYAYHISAMWTRGRVVTCVTNYFLGAEECASKSGVVVLINGLLKPLKFQRAFSAQMNIFYQ